MLLSSSVTNKLMLARHLFWLALDNLRAQREVALMTAVNLLQDSVEAFLLAASEQLNAGIEASTRFDQYIAKIDERIQPRELPFRSKLIGLNKARVNSKHYGIRPHRDELESFSAATREFLSEGCLMIFQRDFWLVSLVDLLEDGEVKTLLQAAEEAHRSSDWFACMAECRKVIFLEVEKNYDIYEFREGSQERGFFGPFSDAPYFAQNLQYINERVCTPFDYIVVDHAQLSSKLTAEGVDPQVYWNIWRLTPPVYRFRDKDQKVGEWLVKRELIKEDGANSESAAYVLEQTIDLALHLSHRRRLLRYSERGTEFYVDLRNEGVTIYDKADKGSAVRTVTRPGLRRLDVDSETVGMDGRSGFWHVVHFDGDADPALPITERMIFGFISSDDVLDHNVTG
jgi:hypothetical protein